MVNTIVHHMQVALQVFGFNITYPTLTMENCLSDAGAAVVLHDPALEVAAHGGGDVIQVLLQLFGLGHGGAHAVDW